MLKDVLLMRFINRPCARCDGTGFSDYGFKRITCDRCRGSGKHNDPLVLALGIVVLLLITVAPVAWAAWK